MKPQIYSVSQLSQNIKTLLEEKFPIIWICGEISNFTRAASGHFYFTLKDENAQINAVMFAAQNKKLKFNLENGMLITGLGRIAVYEPKGKYQIIFELIQPKGLGEIQKAFEQLKDKLSKEGLFDSQFKSLLPFFPCKISVITSPAGAVVHDIIKIAVSRYPNISIKILPVKVQGEDSEDQIVSALKTVNNLKDSDAVIIARGGGSIEDFHAFNSESVARAIFKSKIPVICAAGHETDFTIADFTADLRSPTPSAAAETLIPEKYQLSAAISSLLARLNNSIYNNFEDKKILIKQLTARLIHPKRKLNYFRLKTDDITQRLLRAFERNISLKRGNLKSLNIRLDSSNPENILKKGYSITRTIKDNTIVTDSNCVKVGDKLEILLSKGRIVVEVDFIFS